MAVLDESTFQAVNNSNFKVMSDQVLLSTNLMAQNAAANQQAMNLIGQAAAGATIKSLTEVDPLESVSVANVLRGELAPVISQLGAAVSAIQQLSKTAGSTPPVTINNELPKTT